MRLSYVIMAAALILSVSGCKSYELESEWRDREITIDGEDEDWEESRFHIQKEDIVAGVGNDENFLYLCLYPSDNTLSQKILRQGLTVWLNTDGKTDKELGIRFPIPKHPADVRDNFEKGDKTENKIRHEMLGEVEIVGSDNELIKRFKPSELKGLQLAMQNDRGTLIYELKIPLKSDLEYSVSLNSETGSTVALGFEVEEMELPDMPNNKGEMADDLPAGGIDGNRGRSGGMGRGRGGQRSVHDEKPDTSAEEFWLKINLAKI